MKGIDPVRSDLSPWTLRGMGLALGAAIVIGLIALASAAGSVLVLFFLTVLLTFQDCGLTIKNSNH